ncbi:hypothetical protein NDU88_013100 [Pleurodeles waltl]|uniref:Uncharacterized protein n=1 Tax=Pleurodeles waltl TaxID=8319 RepID=A0AAV7R4N9_PLEWA|nr:hypothetical protein NDU88_013100 [Pleurodeles waltl]
MESPGRVGVPVHVAVSLESPGRVGVPVHVVVSLQSTARVGVPAHVVVPLQSTGRLVYCQHLVLQISHELGLSASEAPQRGARRLTLMLRRPSLDLQMWWTYTLQTSHQLNTAKVLYWASPAMTLPGITPAVEINHPRLWWWPSSTNMALRHDQGHTLLAADSSPNKMASLYQTNAVFNMCVRTEE